MLVDDQPMQFSVGAGRKAAQRIEPSESSKEIVFRPLTRFAGAQHQVKRSSAE
jgi:hypothetical protein